MHGHSWPYLWLLKRRCMGKRCWARNNGHGSMRSMGFCCWSWCSLLCLKDWWNFNERGFAPKKLYLKIKCPYLYIEGWYYLIYFGSKEYPSSNVAIGARQYMGCVEILTLGCEITYFGFCTNFTPKVDRIGFKLAFGWRGELGLSWFADCIFLYKNRVLLLGIHVCRESFCALTTCLRTHTILIGDVESPYLGYWEFLAILQFFRLLVTWIFKLLIWSCG